MCGIVAISASNNVSLSIYEALLVLQHRGQDSTGIVTENCGKIHHRKKNGLVDQVFCHPSHLEKLTGKRGIGHVRYPTAGSLRQSEVQPFFVSAPYGIVLAHNGNLTNATMLKTRLQNTNDYRINSDNDSEILLNIFANALYDQARGGELSVDHIFAAVEQVQQLCHGAYSVVMLIVGYGIVAFRDKFGIRPLVYGTDGKNHAFASESLALSVLDYQYIGDVDPGEAVYIDDSNQIHRKRCVTGAVLKPCVFEYVYLSRPDSTINGVSVYRARRNMGKKLGEKISRTWPDHDIDLVVGVPDTSRIAAVELAKVLNVPYREALIKNRYIGRTFIMPNQSSRLKSVKRKLNTIDLEFKDRNVLLVDDSIVRGNTSHQIVRMAREAGAKKVYLASAAPPVRYQNVYGIDVPSKEELLMGSRSHKEAEAFIGCDKLIYQDVDDLEQSVCHENSSITSLEKSVFTGEYIIGNIDEEYLASLEANRNDKTKDAMCEEQEKSATLTVT